MTPVLAIDTSAGKCGIAVFISENLNSYSILTKERGHAKQIHSMIDSVCSSLDISLKEIESVVVTEGPGSFTGLRLGFSLAKSISFALKIPVITVPVFEVLFSEQENIKDKFAIASAIKASSTEMYFAIEKNFRENNSNKIEVISISDLDKKLVDFSINFLISDVNTTLPGIVLKSNVSPHPLQVVRCGLKTGKVFSGEEIDLLSPNYIKPFLIKERKNVK